MKLGFLSSCKILLALALVLGNFGSEIRAGTGVKKENALKTCYPKDTEAWLIRELYTFTRNEGLMFKYLVSKLGEPEVCSGKTTRIVNEYEKYGTFLFKWKTGQTLKITSMSPGISIAEFKIIKSFAKDSEIFEMLQNHVKSLEWDVDWTKVTKSVNNTETIEEYSDKNPGKNAIVRLKYDKKSLMEFSVSMAP